MDRTPVRAPSKEHYLETGVAGGCVFGFEKDKGEYHRDTMIRLHYLIAQSVPFCCFLWSGSPTVPIYIYMYIRYTNIVCIHT